jgi:hypothetical protein
MKPILIYVTSAILIFGTASAREVNMSPIVTLYRAIVERRVAQLNSADREGGVLCTTRYITATRGDGSSTTRKSVDCEE